MVGSHARLFMARVMDLMSLLLIWSTYLSKFEAAFFIFFYLLLLFFLPLIGPLCYCRLTTLSRLWEIIFKRGNKDIFLMGSFGAATTRIGLNAFM